MVYKILDLFCGIGGTAKGFHDALKKYNIDYEYYVVDIDKRVLEVHRRVNPDSIPIIRDAYTFSKEELERFDFVWASPPCETHSVANFFLKRYNPDLRLYDLIIRLKESGVKYIVENVKPFYNPLIPYNFKIDRHVFWTNVFIGFVNYKRRPKQLPNMSVSDLLRYHDLPKDVFDGLDIPYRVKRKWLRNMVNHVLAYNIALYVIEYVFGRDVGVW